MSFHLNENISTEMSLNFLIIMIFKSISNIFIFEFKSEAISTSFDARINVILVKFHYFNKYFLKRQVIDIAD